MQDSHIPGSVVDTVKQLSKQEGAFDGPSSSRLSVCSAVQMLTSGPVCGAFLMLLLAMTEHGFAKTFSFTVAQVKSELSAVENHK